MKSEEKSRKKKSASILDSKFLQMEYMFLYVGLIFGLLFVFINPPWQSNDEDRHFYVAYKYSEMEFFPKYKDGVLILPRSVLQLSAMYQGIPFRDSIKISKKQLELAKKQPLNINDKIYYKSPTFHLFNPALFPHAIGVFVARILNTNPISMMWLSRAFGLFAYLLIIFYAIKIIPIHKGVFFLLGLTPMFLYQGASVTYDALKNASAMLIIAMCVYYAFSNRKFGLKDILLLIIVSAISTQCKSGYPLIPFFFLLIPLKKYDVNKWLSIVLFVLFAMFYWIIGYSISAIGSSITLLDSGMATVGTSVMQNDFIFDSGRNLSAFISDPINGFSVMFNNLISQKENWIGGCIGRFGYAYFLLPKAVIFLHWVILLLVAMLDSNKNIKINYLQKIIIFLLSFGTTLAIIAGFYIGSTATGGEMIFGLQGRYFLPAIPGFLLLLYNSEFDSKSWHKWKPIILTVYISILLIYTLVTINDYYYTI